MASKINFTPEAIGNLRDIFSRIAEDDPVAAARVVSRIRQAIDILAAFPLLGRSGAIEKTRELAIAGLPYTVVYSLPDADTLDVLTVIHQRRKYPPDE